MKSNFVWPIAGVLGLGILVFGLSLAPAQRDRPMEGFRPMLQPGRFTVAHSHPERILILDTATGQVYAVNEKEFKKSSDLPKVGEMPRPRFFERDREKEKRDDPDKREKRERDEKREREEKREKEEKRERDEKREKDLRREKEKP